jgi:hypothetical protein
LEVNKYLGKLHVTASQHPPDSQELSPLDSPCFREKKKDVLKGQRFWTVDEVVTEA